MQLRRVCSVVSLIAGCGTPAGEGNHLPPVFEPYHAGTTLFGTNDNSEVIVALPQGPRALLVGSATRRLSLLELRGNAVVELRTRSLFDNDTTESELTHAAVSPDGTWAAITRTLVMRDAVQAITDCAGQVLLVSLAEGAGFGEILTTIGVGPMPDAVDVSPDGRWIAVANERDVVWGKCSGVPNLAPASVSVLEVGSDLAHTHEVTRVLMGDSVSEREPESLAFTSSSDAVMVSLQDSHEVGLFALSAVVGAPERDSSVVTFTSLPQQPVGVDAWPDGVTLVKVGDEDLFAVAGEANNGLYLVGADGALRGSGFVTVADVGEHVPRDDWGQGTVFQPDSLISFTVNGTPRIAMTLKSAGAVGFWDVSAPDHPRLERVVSIGLDERSDGGGPSSVAPEGITALASDEPVFLTANEGESSVSVIRPW